MTPHAADRSRKLRCIWRTSLIVWAALLGLLFLSLGVAYVPMGKVTTAAGLLIAAIKAALVLGVFMKLRRASALVWLAAISGYVMLAVLFALTLADVLSRGP